MSDIKTPRIVRLPEFRLHGTNEMVASRAATDEGPQSLVQHVLARFPFHPAYTAYHPDLIRDARLQATRRLPSELKLTDRAMHLHFLKESRDAEIERRIETRRLAERDAAKRHDKAWVEAELMRRWAFHEKVREIIHERTDTQLKARRLQLAFFDFIREFTLHRTDTWNQETRQKIIQAFDKRHEWLTWRLAHLFGTAANGGVFRMPGFGEPLEKVLGEAQGLRRQRDTESHWQWRRDNLFVTLPNGGLSRAEGGGQPVEEVNAKVHVPVLENRREAFAAWRAQNSWIRTPNGGLARMSHQGSQPEAATAALAQPLKFERTERHWEYRRSGLVEKLPNGSVGKLEGHGHSSIKTHADLYWPARDEVQTRTDAWRAAHRYAATANGGYAPLPEVGHSYEHVSAARAEPEKQARTERHQEWHAHHRFGPTPNGGYAPLKHVGQSHEKITAEFAERLKDAYRETRQDWRESHRYAPTPNGGYAPLKHLGQSLEKTAADYAHNLKHDGTRAPMEARRRDHPQQEMEAREIGQSMTYREKAISELETESGAAMPLPSAGRPADEASTAVAHRRDAQAHRDLHEIQRSLAAHEPQTSLLQEHVTREEPLPPLKRHKI